MIEIKIPKLGLTMESAKLVRWEFGSGDAVKEGDILLVIETDKVSYEVTASSNGILHPIAAPGSTCDVEEIVGYLAEDRDEYDRLIAKQPSVEGDTLQPAETGEGEGASRAGGALPAAGSGDRIKSSPLARSMAAEHGLDLKTITGSGPGGRIVKADILRLLEEESAAPAGRREPPPRTPADAPAKTPVESIPIQGVRKIIFENMYQSLAHSAQLTLHTEASAEAIVSLRERMGSDGKKISYNAILMKITAAALQRHPNINASVEEDTIHVWQEIHIGLAMEANDALIVPVVRHPDLKTIGEIDRDIRALIQKTRENKLSPDDLTNGTFTISNLGFEDIDYFTPIIRPPESAILGVGRIIRRPVVEDERIIPQHRLGLSLTFDHRIIDGAPGARFLKAIKEMIEAPLLMIT